LTQSKLLYRVKTFVAIIQHMNHPQVENNPASPWKPSTHDVFPG